MILKVVTPWYANAWALYPGAGVFLLLGATAIIGYSEMLAEVAVEGGGA